MKIFNGIPQIRYHSPFLHNIFSGITIAFTAGIYVALNLLGAGGGRPQSAWMTTRLNACSNSIWVLSSAFGSVVLHTIGPGITACLGVLGYVLYVGALWFYTDVGTEGFPFFGAVVCGISAGLIYVTNGYIMLSYPEEKEKGLYVTVAFGLQATGSIIGSIIPLLIARNNDSSGGVPTAVYIAFTVIMFLTAVLALFILPPNKLTRDDGSGVAAMEYRGVWKEFKSNCSVFKDKYFLMMIPCFLPAECFLVYLGSTNAFHNNLRTRCLCSFMAVVLQIPFSIILQKILDHTAWRRRTRALAGLVYVGVPLLGAWIWEIIRTRNYNRADPPQPMDWTDSNFAPIFILFLINWIASSLWQYVIVYFLGCLTNDPIRGSHYAGVFRAVLASGESIVFGLDSLEIPYIKEAGIIFCFYATGVLIFIYMAIFVVEETRYFKEEHVVVPQHVLTEMGMTDGEAVTGAVVTGREADDAVVEKGQIHSRPPSTKEVQG